MTETFAALLAAGLRTEPGRPFVTYYDGAGGERTELSLTTYANWVAKTSSLFVEALDLERGGRLLVDLPAHWLGPVFLGAAWNAGLAVVTEGDADGVVCGPSGLDSYADRAAQVPVLATALHPLGLRFADPLPAGVHDFGVEVWSEPDAFVPWDPPTGEDDALDSVSQRELLTRPTDLAPGARLLSSANPVEEPSVFLDPLRRDGSVVLVANPPSEDWLASLRETERVTAG